MILRKLLCSERQQCLRVLQRRRPNSFFSVSEANIWDSVQQLGLNWELCICKGVFFPGKLKGMLKWIEFDLDVAAQDAVVECLTFYSVHCW